MVSVMEIGGIAYSPQEFFIMSNCVEKRESIVIFALSERYRNKNWTLVPIGRAIAYVQYSTPVW